MTILPRPGMRLLVSAQEPLVIDFGIALRRGEIGVAEEFLNRAQIAAAGQQMRGETMTEGMRGGGVRQAENNAKLADFLLEDGRHGSALPRAPLNNGSLGVSAWGQARL